jgi:hypothetical protein
MDKASSWHLNPTHLINKFWKKICLLVFFCERCFEKFYVGFVLWNMFGKCDIITAS